jgi:predicted ribosomally synthesized peptide with SipW-like signal peptide
MSEMMWQGGGSTLAFYTASAAFTNIAVPGTLRLGATLLP